MLFSVSPLLSGGKPQWEGLPALGAQSERMPSQGWQVPSYCPCPCCSREEVPKEREHGDFKMEPEKERTLKESNHLHSHFFSFLSEINFCFCNTF